MPYANPEDRRAYDRKWEKTHRTKRVAAKNRRRKRLRKRFDKFKKGLACEMCGEAHPACIDFHHRDPKEKEFALGEMLSQTGAGWNRIMEEVKKCAVLCANCHRKVHYGA